MAVTAAASGTQTPTSQSITSSTNATPIVITKNSHGFTNGQVIYIVGHTTNTAANGTWTVANVTANTLELSGSVGNGVGGATGTMLLVAEAQLADTAASGVYTFEVDTAALAAGDLVELRVYKMILTAGTSRVLYAASFSGAQPTDDAVKVSLPVANELTDATSLRFSLLQRYGVARAFPWKVLKIAA
jgi:hypothetical protein